MKIKRHLTAITRRKLSKPVEIIESRFMTPEMSFLDYGCGKGEDVDFLRKMGYNVTGYDPFWLHETPEGIFDVVNLSYVLDVIENYEERVETIRKAWKHTSDSLFVTVRMMNTLKQSNSWIPFKDGFITSKETFQKYFKSWEMEGMIMDALNGRCDLFGVFRGSSPKILKMTR